MKKIIIGLTIIACLGLYTFGEEGMWLLTQIKNLQLEKKGFEISAEDIYSKDKPSMVDATLSFGGGTGEFVSSNGLVLTNHHVAFSAVQRASTKGTDFITNGFLAKTFEEEIEGPGFTARLMLDMKDVTHEFRKYDKIKDISKRDKTIQKKMKALTEKVEKGKTDISGRVSQLYNGKKYILYTYKRFDDIRVVYVPPLAVGNYGGDIDNWMWPRHTGDFSFMRVYVAPDGTGRKYHKDNVPYKPKKWFKIATGHLKKGDQTFILGYPGRTTRYRTSYSVKENLYHNYPDSIKYMQECIEILEGFFNDSQVARAKVAGMHKGLNNYMKNLQGNVDGMTRTNFVGQKLTFEKELMEFLKKDPKLFEKHGKVLDNIKVWYDEDAKYRDIDRAFQSVGRMSGTMFGIANGAFGVAKEREKPKKERNPFFSEKDVKRGVDRLGFRYLSYYEPSDIAFFTKMLKTMAALPEAQKFKETESYIKDNFGSIEAYVKKAYAQTKLKDQEFAKSLYSKSSKELEALNDPFINLVKTLYPSFEKRRKRLEKAGAKLTVLRKDYINALYAWKGSNLYPDADRSFRFSLGTVEGYKPRDAVYYKPFTTIKGMLEKDTGKNPFNMPQALKDLYAKKDFGRWMDPKSKDVTIAFTHKVDSTGGNSGSPVLNTKGELIGILFDGNYEAMTGDWQYDAKIQRSISVDIRYVMFIVEKLAKADFLLKEMGI